jgi:hypothetical protein
LRKSSSDAASTAALNQIFQGPPEACGFDFAFPETGNLLSASSWPQSTKEQPLNASDEKTILFSQLQVMERAESWHRSAFNDLESRLGNPDFPCVFSRAQDSRSYGEPQSSAVAPIGFGT